MDSKELGAFCSSCPDSLSEFGRSFLHGLVRSRALEFRLIFAYNVSMFPTPSGRKTFVVQCKRCRRDVPSGRVDFQ
jgi:hypothetical protein